MKAKNEVLRPLKQLKEPTIQELCKMNRISLQYTDEAKNSCKYYIISLDNPLYSHNDKGSAEQKVQCEWGRIGSSSQTSAVSLTAVPKKLAEKLKKGYRFVEVISHDNTPITFLGENDEEYELPE